jgi:hypothetical protein
MIREYDAAVVKAAADWMNVLREESIDMMFLAFCIGE